MQPSASATSPAIAPDWICQAVCETAMPPENCSRYNVGAAASLGADTVKSFRECRQPILWTMTK